MRPIVCMRGLKSGAHFPDRLYIPANFMLPWKRKEKIQNHRVCRGLLRMIFHFPGILFPYKYLPVNNGISWVPRPFCRLHFIPAEQYCHPDIFQKINFPPFLLPETCVPRVRAENVTADTPFAAGANHFFSRPVRAGRFITGSQISAGSLNDFARNVCEVPESFEKRPSG